MNAAPTPLQLARLHQQSIKSYLDRAHADASCIRQIMVGRYVRNGITRTVHKVTQVRLGLNWTVMLYGPSRKRRGRPNHPPTIGTITDIEIVSEDEFQ